MFIEDRTADVDKRRSHTTYSKTPIGAGQIQTWAAKPTRIIVRPTVFRAKVEHDFDHPSSRFRLPQPIEDPAFIVSGQFQHPADREHPRLAGGEGRVGVNFDDLVGRGVEVEGAAGRVTGFSLATGADLRGFAGAAGNVLVDGERPTIKAGGLVDFLSRIPADAVERIEVTRGAQRAGETAGQSLVANVIRKPQTFAATWSGELERNPAGRSIRAGRFPSPRPSADGLP